MSKQFIKVPVRYTKDHSEICELLQGRLKDIQTNINKLIQEFGEEGSVSIDTNMYDGLEVLLTSHRMETDIEFRLRLNKEESDRKQKEQSEHAMYEQLKKKFEG
jgi:hypothetical protein